MTVDLALVRSVCAARELDSLEVYDQAKRSILYDAEGAAEVLQALDQLPGMLSGTFRLVARHGAAKKTAGAKVYEWVVQFDGPEDTDARSEGVGSVDRPTWAEFMDLRLQMQAQELRAELQPADGGHIGKLVEMLGQIMQPGGVGAAAPAPAPAPAPVPASAAPGALPPEVLAAARNVAALYRQDPAAFAQYAPLLAQMVQPDEK